MTMDKFETSMDRIVKALEGDSPNTDIYAGSLERIADALENGGGGGSGSTVFLSHSDYRSEGDDPQEYKLLVKEDESFITLQELNTLLRSGTRVVLKLTHDGSTTDYDGVELAEFLCCFYHPRDYVWYVRAVGTRNGNMALVRYSKYNGGLSEHPEIPEFAIQFDDILFVAYQS